jgi:hypothetical protein
MRNTEEIGGYHQLQMQSRLRKAIRHTFAPRLRHPIRFRREAPFE